MKITIIIPVYNEINTIKVLLQKVINTKVEKQIIVVDDFSTDGTREVLIENFKNKIDKLVLHKKNLGKGSAIISAKSYISGDFVIIQDADLEYDPNDYKKLLEPVLLFKADLVIGSRLSASQLTRVYYFWHKMGNKLITLLFNILNNTTFTDIYSCYLVFKSDLVKPEKLLTAGWEQQAEILSMVISKGKSFYEVPINYYGRTYDEGKKIRARHAFAVLLTILKKKFFPF